MVRRLAIVFVSSATVVAMALVAAPISSAMQPQTIASVPEQARHAPNAGPLSTPTFGEPTISGIAGNGFEQDLRLDPTNPNRVYTSAPASLSSTHGWIWKSQDAGKTFKWVSASTPLTGKLPSCVGGGDTELAVDVAGRLYMNDLTLANFSTSRSDDQGKTFLASCTGVQDTGVDREWYAVDGDPLNGGNVFLANDDLIADPVCSGAVANNILVMQRSPIPGAEASAGVTFNPPYKITGPTGPGGSCTEGIMGNNEVSPVSHKIFVVHDTAAFDAIRMARCVTVPFTTDPSGLSCVDKLVSSFPGQVTGGSFPTMAIDSAGNLFTVWEQAPGVQGGPITGDTVLKFSASLYPSEGDAWTTPITIPQNSAAGTLHNNVFAWIAAGDAGKVDIAWYGTTAPTAGTLGPDSTSGKWGLYFTQALNGTAASPTFAAPILASEHFIHNGTIQTVMGGQNGDRTLGDFLQLRIGSQGEAQISYSDSNNVDEFFPKAMYVKQNGGSSVSNSNPTVNGAAAPRNAVTDAAGDATFDAAGAVSANVPNMDILSSSITQPDPATYRIRMMVASLGNLAPPTSTGDADNTVAWLTQWLVPSNTDPNGGKNFFAYMESTAGQAPTFWDGENAYLRVGGGVAFTYPGVNDITGNGATGYNPATGEITIDVPVSHVAEAGAIDTTLYSVTASSITSAAPLEIPPPDPVQGIGGQLFNLFDPAPVYDVVPGTADLAVTKLATPNPVAPNAPLTYTLTVTNKGPDFAQGVSLTDSLPAGQVFVSATPSQGSCSGTGTVTCSLGTLTPASVGTVSIVVKPTSNGGYTNNATASSTTADPVSANNSGSVSGTVGPASSTPGFHAPVTVPGSTGGGNEPSLAITKDGYRYVSWQIPGEFAGSTDGVNFTSLAQPDPDANGDVSNRVTYSGALYNVQICGIGTPTGLHTCLYRSLDGGHTWVTRNIIADNNPGASDRPWIDVYPKGNTTATASDPDKDVVYLEYHTFSPEDLVYVTKSTDGGLNFGLPTPVEQGTNATDSLCNTVPGGITVDQTTGNVYALWLSGNDVESNVHTGCNYTQIGPFSKAWVAKSYDGGATWSSALAWAGTIDALTKVGDNASKIFSTIILDQAGQVHIALTVRHNDDPLGFATECQTNPDCVENPNPTDLYLVTSPDGGAHWTPPFQINQTTGSFFFPWIAAGSAGVVQAAYYSSSTLQPNEPGSVWYVGTSRISGAVAQYTGGATASYVSPPVATSEILLNPTRVHGDGTAGGGICTYGLFCEAVPGSNRDLGDCSKCTSTRPAGRT